MTQPFHFVVSISFRSGTRGLARQTFRLAGVLRRALSAFGVTHVEVEILDAGIGAAQ